MKKKQRKFYLSSATARVIFGILAAIIIAFVLAAITNLVLYYFT